MKSEIAILITIMALELKPPRLSWNHYIVTGFPYKITPGLLLILFHISADTFAEAGA